MTITATNHGPDPAPLHLLPQLWFRNTWAWGRDDRIATLHAPAPARRATSGLRRGGGRPRLPRPVLPQADGGGTDGSPDACSCSATTRPTSERLFGAARNAVARTPRTAIDRAGRARRPLGAVNPADAGTKAAFWYRFDAVPPGETVTRPAAAGRRTRRRPAPSATARRRRRATADAEADEFYDRSSTRACPTRTGTSPAAPTPGCCGASSSTATTSTSGSDGDPTADPGAGAAGARAGRPQHRLAARRPRRRHLDAGRVGVPLVRRLGPRLPRRSRWRTSTRPSPRSSWC